MRPDVTRGSASSSGPSASVVITTYNQARFLSSAIESVREQTVAPDELIVVDDGSTDDPGSIVCRYPATRLIRQRNRGVSAARNAGLRAARGRYVLFLDAGDRLMREALRSNLRHLAKNPESAFVHGDYYFINATGQHRSSPPARLIDEDA